MTYKNLQKNTKGNGGYTLLFAVLVSSLLLAISISILSISKKEFLLATSARDSSSAFYAADSAVECAIHGDYPNGAFIGYSPDKSPEDAHTLRINTVATKLGCKFESNSIPVSVTDVDVNNISFIYDMSFGGGPNGPCASVTVRKIRNPSSGDLSTDIEARGYNTGWTPATGLYPIGHCDTLGPKRVERAIHYKY